MEKYPAPWELSLSLFYILTSILFHYIIEFRKTNPKRRFTMPYGVMFIWGLPVYLLVTTVLFFLAFTKVSKEKLGHAHFVLFVLFLFIGFFKMFDYATPYDTEFLKQGNHLLLAFVWVMLVITNLLMALRIDKYRDGG